MKPVVIGALSLSLAMLGGARTDANQMTAQEFWDSMLAAKGGRPRLHAVHSLVVSSSVRLAPWSASDVASSVNYEFVAEFPHRFWGWEDYRPGKMGFSVESWNLETKINWSARSGGKAERLGWSPTSEHSMMCRMEDLQVQYLLETAYLKPKVMSLAVDTQTNIAVLDVRTPCYVSVEYLVDVSTRLPKKVRITEIVPSGRKISLDYFFDGTVDVDGILMPRRVQDLGEVRFIMNPPLDPRLFDTPPDDVTSRDAWRKWLKQK